MAIATRTRSKLAQSSTNEKDFQQFLNTLVFPDNTSSTTSSSSSSSSSYYWSEESPDSVVPGSTSSDDSSTTTTDHISIQGSSTANIQSLPGFTKNVDVDVKVSISLVTSWFTTFIHFYKKF